MLCSTRSFVVRFVLIELHRYGKPSDCSSAWRANVCVITDCVARNVKQSIAGVHLSVRFHSIFIEPTNLWIWFFSVGYDHSWRGIESQGHRWRSSAYERGNAVTRSVWPREEVFIVFSCFWFFAFYCMCAVLRGSLLYVYVCTLCLKKHPDIFSYNLSKQFPIWIIFGTNIT